MLARVAENIYWLSRYLERAENTVRLVETHSSMLLDLADQNEHSDWIPLVRINALDEEFAKRHTHASEVAVCDFLLADSENSGSLTNCFVAIHNNLRSCRDILPRSSYEAINSTCRLVKGTVLNTATTATSRNAYLSSIRTRLLAISADLDSNMCHDIAFRFMSMGRGIERADMTSRIIDVQSSRLAFYINDDENEALLQQRWVFVLRTLSALQMYRQNVRRPINGPDTLTFLLLNSKLPRSYLYCLEHLDECLTELSNHDAPRKAVETLRQRLNDQDLAMLAEQPMQLHGFIDTLQQGMQDIAVAIAETYFLPPQDT